MGGVPTEAERAAAVQAELEERNVSTTADVPCWASGYPGREWRRKEAATMAIYSQMEASDLITAAQYQRDAVAANQAALVERAAAQAPAVGHVAVEKTPTDLNAAADAADANSAQSGGPPRP